MANLTPASPSTVSRAPSIPFEIGLNAVITAVTDETPRVLLVKHPKSTQESSSAALEGLPYGPLDPIHDRTLERGLRGWVREQTGIELGYVEQLYTFGDLDRDPGLARIGRRVISIAYLALVRETPLAGLKASWRDWYSFFPWEDWRDGRPEVLDRQILPALEAWLRLQGSESETRERLDICFGCHGASWNWERVLDRYELLYEAGLVAEACQERCPQTDPAHPEAAFGRPLLLDHRRILATALDRIRGKLRYRPVVFELLPPLFTLFQLQRLVEALAGFRLHKQNFRRLVEKAGLVEGTGQIHRETGGRPAELFRFRREVLRERPAPGVSLPGGQRVTE